MSIFNILVAWLFLMAAYLLWWKYRDDKLHGKSFFNFGDFNFLMAALTALLVSWAALTLFSPEPRFKNADEQIAFGKKTRQPWLVTKALWEKTEAAPKDPDYAFDLIQQHFLQEEENFSPPDANAYAREGNRIFNYYTELSEKEDAEYSDLGYLFLADWYIEKPGHDPEAASFCLRQVKNKKLKYVNYISGRILLFEAGPEAAEEYFQQEIKLNGYKTGAWEGLATCYDLMGRTEELEKLVNDPRSRNAVPEEYRYKIYFLDGNLPAFYQLRFADMLDTLPFWGLLGDLLILFTWLFFLRRLSFLSPVKWKHFFLATGIGALLAMISWLLYEFYHHVLHFWTNGEIGNDFLFSFLGIGCIEELVKLVPFLLLLRFTNIIKKPIDYLLIASAAGLGFAFFENLLYISQYGLDVIHSRALTASVSHMASSAIVAYGFVLVKFRYPKKHWIIPAFFLLAALAHGFYDFWLLNDKVHSLAIVTLFFFLSEVLVYVSFINNALNQSVPENNKAGALSLNTQRLAAFLAGALILVFLIEYIGTCFVYGTIIGNKTLLNAFLSGGYLVFFLSVRLSNIDILPGEWMKVEFFSGLLPSEIMGSARKLNHNSVPGLNLVFVPARGSERIIPQLPLSGTVKKRITFRRFSGWFEVELEEPLQTGFSETGIIYIRAKNPGELIRLHEKITVGVFVPTGDTEKFSLEFFDWVNVD